MTLSSAASDLDKIYYTTDGSVPDNTDTEYTGPISITGATATTTTTVLKFIGYDTLGNSGPVGTETYVIDKEGPTVTASPTGGTFATDQLVTLSSAASDLDKIYYTTDGSVPDNTDTEYTGPISITGATATTTTTVLKFIGYDTLGNSGPVGTETYVIDKEGPTVTASPTGGTFATDQLVTLSSAASDLDKIYYTTDGSVPDNTDTEYTGPISITGATATTTTTVLKFIGYDTLGNSGPVGTETYVIDKEGPTVTASPTGGTFATDQLVTLSSAASDLDKIYYTTDGSVPDNTDTEYTGPISITGATATTTTTVLKFIGYDTLGNSGPVGTETYVIDKEGPTVTASPTGGTFATDQLVTLSSAASDLDKIYYTTDGSVPDNTDTEYTGPISITGATATTTTTVLKFIGYDTLGNSGPVGTETYVIDKEGPTVTASPTGGTFATDQLVTLSSAASDLDKIYYTTDGSVPDNTDTEYTGPISITGATATTTTTVLKFIGYDTLGNSGPVGTETYIIDKEGPTVTASPTGGTFATDQLVTLSSAASDLDKIYYTTDGSVPDNTDTEYTGPISITGATATTTTTVLKFIGYDTLGNSGPVGTETYVIDKEGPTVTASPTGGTFATDQLVTLSSAASDLDKIYYTTDGSAPDNTDTEYTGPISITGATATTTTTVLKFIGYDTLGNSGPVGTETYIIDKEAPSTTIDSATVPSPNVEGGTSGEGGTNILNDSPPISTEFDSIRFEFSGDDESGSGLDHFVWTIDGSVIDPCTSPKFYII